MNSETNKEPTKRLKVTTGLKGGRLAGNHNTQLKVTTGLKAGRIAANHNRQLKVMAGLRGDK